MKAVAAVAAGLVAFLAGCDSAGSAPDGSANGIITSTRTEYQLSSGVFVACDSLANDAARTGRTQVGVKFTLNGTIQTIQVALKGTHAAQVDPNFTKVITGAELASLGGNTFKVTFDADAGSGALLPLGITVNPAAQKVKLVTVTTYPIGSFYPVLDVNTGSSTFSLKDQKFGTVDVYQECTVLSVTAENV